MRDNVLPRTFTDDKKLVHVQWPRDSVYGVEMACGRHLTVHEFWDGKRQPVTCLLCFARTQ